MASLLLHRLRQNRKHCCSGWFCLWGFLSRNILLPHFATAQQKRAAAILAPSTLQVSEKKKSQKNCCRQTKNCFQQILKKAIARFEQQHPGRVVLYEETLQRTACCFL